MKQNLKERKKKKQSMNPANPVVDDLESPQVSDTLEDINSLLTSDIDEILETTEEEWESMLTYKPTEVRDECGCSK